MADLIPNNSTSKKSRKKDLTGQRFTRILVLEEAGKTASQNIKWRCKCDCGKEIITVGSSLLNGDTKSCGCLSKDRLTKIATKHGLWKHPLFGVWQSMNDRCKNNKIPQYKDYGGRGVVVCDEWQNDFKAFYDWAISNGWQKGLELDKDIISKQLGVEPLLYSPDRCSFVTAKKNSRNRRNNHLLTVDGKTATIAEWTEEYNLSIGLISQRINKLRWTPKEAIFGKTNSN